MPLVQRAPSPWRWLVRLALVGGGALVVAAGLTLVDLARRLARGEVKLERLGHELAQSRTADSRDAVGFNRPAIGPRDAPVTVVEFYDFQCPYCKQAAAVVAAVAQSPEFAPKVRFVFRHFPLVDIHANALDAALAGECAHQAGQYWPMRQRLFADQNRLARTDLEQSADAVGIPRQEFTRCLVGEDAYRAVEADWRVGLALGVKATPTYFIGGEKIAGEPSLAQLQQAIVRQLPSTP